MKQIGVFPKIQNESLELRRTSTLWGTIESHLRVFCIDQSGTLVSGVGHSCSRQMALVIYCSLRERVCERESSYNQTEAERLTYTQEKKEDSPISSLPVCSLSDTEHSEFIISSISGICFYSKVSIIYTVL